MRAGIKVRQSHYNKVHWTYRTCSSKSKTSVSVGRRIENKEMLVRMALPLPPPPPPPLRERWMKEKVRWSAEHCADVHYCTSRTQISNSSGHQQPLAAVITCDLNCISLNSIVIRFNQHQFRWWILIGSLFPSSLSLSCALASIHPFIAWEDFLLFSFAEITLVGWVALIRMRIFHCIVSIYLLLTSPSYRRVPMQWWV